MNMEVELKARARKDEEARLKSAGAKKKSTVVQKDTIYDKPNEELRKKGVTLRVREENGKVILTFKKQKKRAVSTKALEEIELRVTPSIHILLQGLGYNPVMKREKIRSEYLLNNITVCLDKVKGLGTWLEFEAFGQEGPCRKKIVETAAMLGIKESSLTCYSYNRMQRQKLNKSKKQN